MSKTGQSIIRMDYFRGGEGVAVLAFLCAFQNALFVFGLLLGKTAQCQTMFRAKLRSGLVFMLLDDSSFCQHVTFVSVMLHVYLMLHSFQMLHLHLTWVYAM